MFQDGKLREQPDLDRAFDYPLPIAPADDLPAYLASCTDSPDQTIGSTYGSNVAAHVMETAIEMIQVAQ